MPSVSEKQHKAMEAAAHGHSTLGIPKSVGQEFVKHDDGGVVTELDIAKAIRDGQMESPQRIGDLWLFDIRITGTGISYRPRYEEYVYRPPEFYLNDKFLERCAGLPVIYDHPDNGQMDTEDFRQRSIGSVMLAYIPTEHTAQKDPSEVWAIVRIHDGDAAELMATTQVSTSPSVTLGSDGETQTVETEDGSRLLIEGEPPYMDHIAVVDVGVWDKGGAPRGVNNGNF